MELVRYNDLLENKMFMPDINETAKKVILAKIENMAAGELYTGILHCNGLKKCPYKTDCPFISYKLPAKDNEEDSSSDDMLPVGQKCPMEITLAKKWYEAYLDEFTSNQQLTRSLNQLVVTLVSIDIEIMRANSMIADEGFEQNVITETETGVKYDKKLHNVLFHIENLQKRREKIITKLQQSKKDAPEEQDLSKFVEALKKRLR